MRTLATLFLFFTVVSLHAQYVGPSLSTLRFRLYGSNARPITASDTVDYAIRNETPILDGLDDRSAFPRTEFQEEYLSIMTLADMGSTSMVAFSIVHKGDTMRVGSNTDIDSVRFTPGTYQIPLEFSARFTMSPTSGVAIAPALSDFRVPELVHPAISMHEAVGRPMIAASVQRIGCGEIRSNNFSDAAIREGITGKIYVRTVEIPQGTRNLVVAAQTGVSPRTLIAVSTDLGESWKRASWPMPDVYAVSMRFTDRDNGWVYGRDSSNRVVYARSTDGGATWARAEATPIPSWPISNKPFYGVHRGVVDATEGVVYKVDSKGPYRESYSLFKSIDRGATWVMLFGSRGTFAPTTMVFADPTHGCMVWDDHLMWTSDGGRNWRFLPIVGQPLQATSRCIRFEVADARIIDEDFLCVFGEEGVSVIDLREQ